jgi:hypothetical protein
MRLAILVLTGVVAAGVVGCASSNDRAGSGVAARSATQLTSPTVNSSPAKALATQLSQTARSDARAAATQFDGIYTSSNFSASWDMLASSTQRQIPRAVWVAVHNQCAATSGATRVVIRSVTIFGNDAVVTTTLTKTGPAGSTEEIFAYDDDGWHYAPGDPSIYQHSSVQADVAAAKAVGLFASGKYF